MEHQSKKFYIIKNLTNVQHCSTMLTDERNRQIHNHDPKDTKWSHPENQEQKQWRWSSARRRKRV